MRIHCIYIAAVMPLALGGIALAQEKPSNKSDKPLQTAKEKVTSSNGTWTRLVGKVKVVNAYTLRFEDGTEANLRFAADAPEPEQQGLIGDTLYPCGKEASEFLAKLIGDKPVALFIDGNVVPGRTPRGKGYVGETHLQLEMVRNGWMVSAHSAMDAWEIIARENKRGLWRGEFIPPKALAQRRTIAG